MKIKKSQLQKLVTEAVLREAGRWGYQDEADQAIKMALNDEEWRQAFHSGEMKVTEIAEKAVEDLIRSKVFVLTENLLEDSSAMEYIEQSILDHWE